MSEKRDPVLEAIKALRADGVKVEPAGDNFALWIVKGKVLTNLDLLALAVLLGPIDSLLGLQ